MEENQVEVEIDRDFCVSAGNCLRFAPGAFVWDDEEISTLAVPMKATGRELLLAERNCPGGAIRVLGNIDESAE